MRILIDHGGHGHANVGDNAMLQIAARRLRELWPGAKLAVMTADPVTLLKICPCVEPIPLEGRWHWVRFGERAGALGRQMSAGSRVVRSRLPVFSYRVARSLRRLGRRSCAVIDQFFSALQGADAVVAAGGGYVNDEFAEYATDILETLAIADRLRKPTAMFGQGIGPVGSTSLYGRMCRAFRSVRLVGVRESLMAPASLLAMGVPNSRICVTGDDAIELAYSAHPREIGHAIGVCIRAARYSGIAIERLHDVREAIVDAAMSHSAEVASIPISFHPSERDAHAVEALMQGVISIKSWQRDVPDPAEVVRAAGKCRVVVTSSYHAAIFALAQGVPAIGLVRSAYYQGKLGGAVSQFGVGAVVNLDDGDLRKRLKSAIEDAWVQADATRELALSAANRQICEGRAAYARFRDIVERL